METVVLRQVVCRSPTERGLSVLETRGQEDLLSVGWEGMAYPDPKLNTQKEVLRSDAATRNKQRENHSQGPLSTNLTVSFSEENGFICEVKCE